MLSWYLDYPSLWTFVHAAVALLCFFRFGNYTGKDGSDLHDLFQMKVIYFGVGGTQVVLAILSELRSSGISGIPWYFVCLLALFPLGIAVIGVRHHPEETQDILGLMGGMSKNLEAQIAEREAKAAEKKAAKEGE